MSDITTELSTEQRARAASDATSRAPAWWIVFLNEAQGLWVGGKAPVLILLFSVVLGAHAFVTAYNVELSLLPPQEMVFETIRTAMAVGAFLVMVVGVDMISGERERRTIEPLLLTPATRRQIVVGKLLAALTPWPAVMALTVPYTAVLAQGNPVLGPALGWGAIVGTIMAIAYASTGLLVSFWSNSNRTSYLVSLGIYILLLVPSQLPGAAQQGAAGKFLQRLNPVAAAEYFLEKTLVNNRTFEELQSWLLSPVIFAALALVPLVLLAPILGPEASWASTAGSRLRRLLGRIAAMLGLTLCLAMIAQPVLAAPGRGPATGPRSLAAGADADVEITVDLAQKVVNAGDAVFFDTIVTNRASSETRPLIVAMNIINLRALGDVVDPEDWSPERTQYIERLGPAESTTLSWRVNAVLDGDYMVYIVVTAQPAGADTTSNVVASSGIHLTVSQFTRLNPRGVIPLVLGSPVVLAVGTALTLRARRRQTEGEDPRGGTTQLLAVAAGVVVALGALSAFAVGSQGAGPGTAAGSKAPQPSGSGPIAITLEVDTAAEPEDFTFAQTDLVAPAGSTITVTLTNRTDADDEVGHNWVLVQPGAEESVLASGLAAGDDNDWLDADDPGIIAHTTLIEGGTSNSVTFEAPEPGIYTFLCTFPDHYDGGGFGSLTIEGG